MTIDWSRLRGVEKYQAYLCSREWSERKKAVHDRAGGMCERCHNSPIDNVHHLTYIRKYRERLSDLQGLCLACHMFIHGEISDDPAYENIPLERPPVLDGIPAAYSCAECGAVDCDFIGRTRPKVYCEPCAVKLDDRRREGVA